MAPLIWIIGGIAAALFASSQSDDDDSYEVADDYADHEAERESARREERKEKERRKKASLEEAKGNLSRVTGRHQRRIASAESTAARSKARLDKAVAIERDFDNLLK